MARLIDADELIKDIEETAVEVEQKMQGRRNGKTLSQGCLSGLACVRESIIRKSTAYDVDKVVEELEHIMVYEVLDGLLAGEWIKKEQVLRIVKDGGKIDS